MDTPVRTRRLPALVPNERMLGLRRVTVPTDLGRIVVRTGRRTGGTTATLLLHGAAGSWTTWTPLVAASDRAGTPLTDLIIPDLPGWGESGALPEGTTVAQVSASLGAVARALGYTSWRIVGQLSCMISIEVRTDKTRPMAAPSRTMPVV